MIATVQENEYLCLGQSYLVRFAHQLLLHLR